MGPLLTTWDHFRLSQLRAATGSADDLEEYVSEMDQWALARCSAAAGGLCDWLLAVEAAAHA
eukprot:8211876-Pyramimonas_sp.AAC.2